MRRRDFITVLASATAWMSAARAQEPRRTIGVLGSASYGALPGAEPAFIQGLKATGFLEGENIGIQWRWAEGQYNRLSSQAAELVDRNVAVIVAFDIPAAFAAKAATKTSPIVFMAGADPVRVGLVESLNQPHGNLTGVSHLLNSLAPKQLELLHEMVPGFRRVALLVNPDNRNSRIDTPEVQAAAEVLGQHLEVLTAGAESDLDTAFATMARSEDDAIIPGTGLL